MGGAEPLEAVDVGQEDDVSIHAHAVAAAAGAEPRPQPAVRAVSFDNDQNLPAVEAAPREVADDEYGSEEEVDEEGEEDAPAKGGPRKIARGQPRSLSSAIGINPKRKRSYRRSLSHRIRQLQEAEDELRLYERMVSRSLDELGLDRDAFDENVTRASTGHVQEVHAASDYTAHERLSLAAALCKLAVLRIDPGSIAWEEARARTFFLIAHEPRWRLFVQLCIATYLVITFFEPPVTHVAPLSSHPAAQPWAWWLVPIEGVCATAYVLDVVFNFGYERWAAILENRQNYFRCAIALACSVDWVLALVVALASGGTVGYVRWSRPLRMLYLPFTNKACFNSVLSIIDTLPSLGDLLLLGLVFTLLYSIIGVTLFSATNLRGPPHNGDDSNAFDSFDLAFVSLLTLMTGENYPSVMWPALNLHPASLLYFAGFVFVGTIVIMPAIVAIVFDYYKRFHGLKVLEEKVVERRCLLMAFALVDEDNSGAISVPEFTKLITAVQPGGSATERSLLYKLLDADGDNTVTAAEFIRLSDALLLDVREARQDVTRLLPCLRRRFNALRAVTASEPFELGVLGTIVAYVVLLAMQAHPATRTHFSVGGALAIDAGYVCVLTLEWGLKVAAHSPAGYWESERNRLDTAMAAGSVLVLCGRVALISAFGAAPADPVAAGALHILSVLRVARTLSVFTHSHKLRVLSATFGQMRPVIGTILGTILMVFYFYLIIGLEAFHGKMDWDAGTAAACLAWCPSFDDATIGIITLLQLVLSANWNEVVYALNGDGGRFVTWTYLISFVLLTNAIMLSLLAALVLEIYSVETEKRVHRSKNHSLATLFPQQALHNDRKGGVSADRYVVVLSNGVRSLFERYDVDGSGAISTLELGDLLKDLGESLSTAELRKVLATIDVNTNGTISFAEFIAWWQRHGLEKVFLKFDEDGSGTIDASELGALMASIGSQLEGEELEAALRELDQDGSGSIGFDEYASWFEDYDVRKVFASFDVDGSGTISKTELESILAHMGIELTRAELREAVARLDSDVDGQISFVEFLPWWKEVSKMKEAKTFTVEHDRSRKWEEALFLRRRESNGLMKLFDGGGGGGGGGGDPQRPDALIALMRAIANDYASGKELSEEYLLSAYGPQTARSDPGAAAEPGAPATERTVRFSAPAIQSRTSAGSASSLLAPLGASSPSRRTEPMWGGKGAAEHAAGSSPLAQYGMPSVLHFRTQSHKAAAAAAPAPTPPKAHGPSSRQSAAARCGSAGGACGGAEGEGASRCSSSSAGYRRAKVAPDPAAAAATAPVAPDGASAAEAEARPAAQPASPP